MAEKPKDARARAKFERSVLAVLCPVFLAAAIPLGVSLLPGSQARQRTEITENVLREQIAGQITAQSKGAIETSLQAFEKTGKTDFTVEVRGAIDAGQAGREADTRLHKDNTSNLFMVFLLAGMGIWSGKEASRMDKKLKEPGGEPPAP